MVNLDFLSYFKLKKNLLGSTINYTGQKIHLNFKMFKFLKMYLFTLYATNLSTYTINKLFFYIKKVIMKWDK